MEYLLLIYGDERAAEEYAKNATPEEQEAGMQDWWKYGAWLDEKGIRRAGEALHDTTQATTVRVRDGETVTTDGPFAETKEQLGGFYLIDVANLDEAIEAAAKCPGAFMDRSRCGRSRSSRRRRPATLGPSSTARSDASRDARRDLDPRDGQLRRRGGRRPGRVPRRAGAVAPDGVPDNPGAWIVTTAEPRDRPPPPRSRGSRRPRRWPGSRPSTWTTRTRSPTSGSA